MLGARVPSAGPARVWCSLAYSLLLAGFVLAGCAKSERLPPLVPVKGVVTADGKPMSAGYVSLKAEETPSMPIPACSGKIGSDGAYEIFTGGAPGAPLGKYKVYVSPSMVPEEGKSGLPFDKKYSDPEKTPLRLEVVANAEAGRYDLKLKKN